MRRMVRAVKIGIVLLVLGLLPPQIRADAAEIPETEKMEDVSHYEWEEVCIYAADVVYTQEDLEILMTEGRLEKAILRDARSEVRIAPNYNLQPDGLNRADISSVQTEVNMSGYEVRLFVENRNEYIDIKLRVYQTEQEIAERNTLEPVAADSGEREVLVETESESQEHSLIYKEDVEAGGLNRRIMVYTIIILAIGTFEFLWVKNDIHVISHHARKKKERIAKRRKNRS